MLDMPQAPGVLAHVPPKSDIVDEMPANSAAFVNDDFDWNAFNSVWYRENHYLTLRDDDRDIMNQVRDFFGRFERQFGGAGRGLDVGPGANLYPALAMLPFCSTIDMWEFSSANVAWLTDQTADYDLHWDAFWDVYRQAPAYAKITDPRVELKARALVQQNSVFKLPAREWDLGTMFFVADSLTGVKSEFDDAVGRFIGALRPGAPFAAAFMKNSVGYKVDELFDPAVAVGCAEVEECLQAVTRDLTVVEIETDSPPREDWGMILATGVAI